MTSSVGGRLLVVGNRVIESKAGSGDQRECPAGRHGRRDAGGALPYSLRDAFVLVLAVANL
jgi:hypothetical protein